MVQAISVQALRRLPQYLRFLRGMSAKGREVVSCRHISEALGVEQTLVRKDIAVTGIVGRPKVGYGVGELIAAIESFLGWSNTTDAVLVGAGNLGSALIGYEGFRDYGLNIVAAFDNDSAKIGRALHGREVFHVDRLRDLAIRLSVNIGILAVPAEAARATCELLVDAGIRAIWNFTPAQLETPAELVVENVNLASSLAVLSNRLNAALNREKPV